MLQVTGRSVTRRKRGTFENISIEKDFFGRKFL